jgi:hypothetical protein
MASPTAASAVQARKPARALSATASACVAVASTPPVTAATGARPQGTTDPLERPEEAGRELKGIAEPRHVFAFAD